MKIFGYTKANENDLKEMDEITLQASPDQLIAIANFLIKCAHKIEKDGPNFHHSHLKDENGEWKRTFPDIIVCSI